MDTSIITIRDTKCEIEIEPRWYLTSSARQWTAEGNVEPLTETKPSEAFWKDGEVLSTSGRINPCIVLTVKVTDPSSSVTGQNIVNMVNAATSTKDECVVYKPRVKQRTAETVIVRTYSNVTGTTTQDTTILSTHATNSKAFEYVPLCFFWSGPAETAARALTTLKGFESGVTKIKLKLQGMSDEKSLNYDVIKEGLVVQATLADHQLPLIQRVRTRSPAMTQEDLAASSLLQVAGAAAVPFRKPRYHTIEKENEQLRAMNES